MKISKAFVTGSKGFLFSGIKQYLNIKETNKNIVDITEDDMKDCDILIHFASPSDSEDFKDAQKMRDMLKGSINVFDIAMKNNIKIIFASSMAAENPENTYGYFKKALELYLEGYDNKLILRIPRVYGKNRNKGLIKRLKSKTFEGTKNKSLDFMDIEDWVKETISILHKTGFYEYNNLQTKTIMEIERIYIKNVED